MNNVSTLTTKREIVTSVGFNDMRLPYDESFANGFGIDNIRWKVLIDTVYPAAKTAEAVAMALSYCKERNLDPFKRPVHIVPMWSAAKGKMVETVWPGISELRTTASRTGEYAGCEAAQFGPTVEQTFTGTVEEWEDGKKSKREATVKAKYPEWCQITVHRFIKGQRVSFVSPKVYWIESYARRGKSDLPNDMWCKRPVGQLEKCAEAAGLRRAFPEEIGNELTAEEMEGQTLFAAAPIGEVDPPRPKLPPPPPPAAPPKPPAAKTEPPKPPAPPPAKAANEPAPAREEAFDFDKFSDAFRAELKSVGHSLDESNEVYARLISDERRLSEEQIEECDKQYREHCEPFWRKDGAS